MACIPSKKINIHEASVLDLKQIPGMKDKLAEKILEYRDQHGPVKVSPNSRKWKASATTPSKI